MKASYYADLHIEQSGVTVTASTKRRIDGLIVDILNSDTRMETAMSLLERGGEPLQPIVDRSPDTINGKHFMSVGYGATELAIPEFFADRGLSIGSYVSVDDIHEANVMALGLRTQALRNKISTYGVDQWHRLSSTQQLSLQLFSYNVGFLIGRSPAKMLSDPDAKLHDFMLSHFVQNTSYRATINGVHKVYLGLVVRRLVEMGIFLDTTIWE